MVNSNALAWIDAGLMPMQHRIQACQAGIIWNIHKTKNNVTLQLILRELLDCPSDPWTKAWMQIQNKIGLIHGFEKKGHLKKALTGMAVTRVMSVKSAHSTLKSLLKWWGWFKLQGYVNDSTTSTILCMIRGGNAQLSNRYKNRYGLK